MKKKTKAILFAGSVVTTQLIGLVGPGEFSWYSIAQADTGGITFSDIAKDEESGITFKRVKSPRNVYAETIKHQPLFTFPASSGAFPMKPSGAPGVAVFDFDNDGDLDMYVTNGPHEANSLYSNQLKETGKLSFIDVGVSSGAALAPLGAQAKEEDNNGVCYGDIDNDNDEDLLVLTLSGQNHLLENQGDGTFVDITNHSQIGGFGANPSSCSMGDVNSDGLLDIAIANTFDNWNDNLPIGDFASAGRNEDNQLLLNRGKNEFRDISQQSGIRNFKGITWAISLVDYDLDGDIDFLTADDQGAKPSAKRGGKDLGYVRIYKNNGKAQFSDETMKSGTNRAGAWMSLSFGDFDSNGKMDIFASNIGDYVARAMTPIVGFPVVPGDWLSGWFLGQNKNSYDFPGVGDLKATPFGWGSAAFDYDNDGNTDIVYYGGMDFGAFVDGTNPGAILHNEGNANFSRDIKALANSTNHSRRTVQGVATGDLDNNGFTDIVSVSSQDWPDFYPIMPILPPAMQFGGLFDESAFIWPTFRPVDPQNPLLGFLWNQIDPVEGSLSVEMNSGDNGNKWVKVKTMGSVGIVEHGRTNRDGIGAVISFTPKHGKPVMQPVLGGSSYASQHSLEQVFGLGTAHSGTLEVLWPGSKVRNRLYDVVASERLTMPEIPCSFEDKSLSFEDYHECVKDALSTFKEHSLLDEKQIKRFEHSAVRAFKDERRGIKKTSPDKA
jgi:hypothetical protein